MLTDMSEIYFPIKRLRDVLPREVFAFSPTGRPITRVALNSDFSTFMLMNIDMNDCYYPREEDMDTQVYMLQAIVKLTQLPKPKGK